jgi:hypothetical protein
VSYFIRGAAAHKMAATPRLIDRISAALASVFPTIPASLLFICPSTERLVFGLYCLRNVIFLLVM